MHNAKKMATWFKLIIIIYLVSYLGSYVSVMIVQQLLCEGKRKCMKVIFPHHMGPRNWIQVFRFDSQVSSHTESSQRPGLKGLVWIFFSKPGINNFQAYTISKKFILSSAISSVLSMSNICLDLKHGHGDNIFNAIINKRTSTFSLKQD